MAEWLSHTHMLHPGHCRSDSARKAAQCHTATKALSWHTCSLFMLKYIASLIRCSHLWFCTSHGDSQVNVPYSARQFSHQGHRYLTHPDFVHTRRQMTRLMQPRSSLTSQATQRRPGRAVGQRHRQVRVAQAPASAVEAPTSHSNDGSPRSAEGGLNGANDVQFNDAASQCPVLRSLQPLPTSSLKWYEQIFLQFTSPGALQQRALAGRPYVQDRFLMRPALVVGSLDTARSLMAREGDDVEIGWPPSVRMLAGQHNVFLIKDREQHAALRRLLNPAFRQDHVDALLPLVAEKSAACLERWAVAGDQGRAVKSFPDLKRFTFDVIAVVLMGDQLSPEELSVMSGHFEVWLQNFFTAWPIDRPPYPFHNSMNSRRALVSMLQRHLVIARERMAAQGLLKADGTPLAKPQALPADACLLERLLLEVDEGGRRLSDEELIDNLIGIFFAGHDTTASTLVSILQLLATHPEVMERLRAEQAALASAHGPELSGPVLAQMRYAEAVIREALRYRVIINGVMRKAKKDFDLDGHLVPAGMTISMGLYSIITTDARWAGSDVDPALDPARFNPDRFLAPSGTEDSANASGGRIAEGAQIPFGMGHRKCLGQTLAMAEMKMFLATLARGYRYSADWNTPFKNFPIPRPANSLPVFVTRIK